MTRARDALNTKRRGLPMVSVDQDYVFEGPAGKASSLDLFEGAANSSSSTSCSTPSGMRDARLAPPHPTRSPTGCSHIWAFPWYSSYGSDFNYHYHVTLDESVAPVEFNFRNAAELEEAGMGRLLEQSSEQPGYSMFVRDGDAIFHTYSMYARGTEMLGGSYYFLDLTVLGRQEEWEEPKGRSTQARAGRPDFSS